MSRRTKTPAERAQEQYDVACRIADRLRAKRDAVESELEQLDTDYGAAVARRDYLAQHPDLPKQQTPTSKSGDDPA